MSPVAQSHLTLSDLERSKSRSLGFQSFISRTGGHLSHMLQLNINRKLYMGSPTALLDFTLSDLAWSNSRSLIFQLVLYFQMEQN